MTTELQRWKSVNIGHSDIQLRQSPESVRVNIGRSVIQLRAVKFLNACLVPSLELGHYIIRGQTLNLSKLPGSVFSRLD